MEYQPFPEIENRDVLQVKVEVPLLLRTLRLPEGVRLLEIGCGSGAALLELAHRLRPAYVAGVDIDASLIEGARRRFADANVRVDLRHVDIRTLPFDEESFDVVIDFGTCYHIGRPSRALREVSRVLRRGGLFVHETPVSQLLAHPIRATGRWLPWRTAPELKRWRTAVLWSARQKVA